MRAAALFLAAVLWSVGAIATATEPVEITLWHYQRDDTSTRTLIAAFEERFPHIKVIPQHMGRFTGEDFFVAVAGGVGPDVVWAAGGFVPNWALGGFIEPLTPWIERYGIQRSDFVPSAWDQAVWDGDIWALPLYVDSNFALTYNRDLLQAAGVEPPRTIAELDEANWKLTEMTSDGVLTRVGLLPWDVHGWANSVFTWGWAFGGSFYDAESGRITANHPRNVEALEWIASLAERYGFENVNNLLIDLPSGHDALMAERVAMRPEHMGIVNGWIRARTPDFNFGLAPMPYADQYVDGPQNWIGGFTLVMSVNSKHKDEAFEFIRFTTADPEGTDIWAQAEGNFVGYLKSPAFERFANSDDFVVRFFTEVLQNARHVAPPVPNQQSYGQMIADALGKVLTGQMPAQQALDEVTVMAQAELERILAGQG